ncbi:MAG TPA: HD domain-containing protein [Blastocatellia bacterium]|nr:HD domain-containing protein [Blastocatellia bacterium]
MPQRNYRDPLHDIISLDESLPDDRLIVALIDSAEFQRLRRIKQLGIALFTYQGAEHSRFTHSIGVMHLMTRALNLLAARNTVSAESRVVGRAGALLHDLGHGPFSHVMEKVFRYHHEDWTCRIVEDEGTEINQVLRGYDARLPGLLSSLYKHNYSPAFVTQLVSSQLDCDRMDYLLRDSLMTGAKYGIYDLEWVLHALKIDEASDRVYVESKGLYAVEEYLQARYYMFRQVYFHRTLRSAEAVLISALTRARELIEQDRLQFRMRDSAFEKMLLGRPVTTREYLQMDDTDLTFHLKQWTREPDAVLADLAARFIDRKLFKAIDLEFIGDGARSLWERAEKLLREAGFDPAYYLVLDRAADVPYYGYYSPVGVDPKSLIYIESGWPRPEIREISEVSEVVRGMRGYRIDRLCFPTEVSEAMSQLAGDYVSDMGSARGQS